MRGWCRTCQAEREVKGFQPPREEMICGECGRPLTSLLNRPKTEAKGAQRRRQAVISPASPAQRAKVKANPVCLVCGIEESDYIAIDPAHLTEREQGGCDHEDCVIGGLCRNRASGSGCHRMFDDGRLDLLVIVNDRWPAHRAELQHALEHVNVVQLAQRLANARTQWSDAA